MRTLEPSLQIDTPIKHPTRPRTKARWRIGFEALQTLWGEQGGPPLRPDQFHARVKTAGLEAPAACEVALEQPNDSGASAAGADEKRLAAAVGEATQRQADNEFDVAKRDGRRFRVRADRA
jgi:hypothetical protein